MTTWCVPPIYPNSRILKKLKRNFVKRIHLCELWVYHISSDVHRKAWYTFIGCRNWTRPVARCTSELWSFYKNRSPPSHSSVCCLDTLLTIFLNSLKFKYYESPFYWQSLPLSSGKLLYLKKVFFFLKIENILSPFISFNRISNSLDDIFRSLIFFVIVVVVRKVQNLLFPNVRRINFH